MKRWKKMAKGGELREFTCVARIPGDNRRVARIQENFTISRELQEFLQS